MAGADDLGRPTGTPALVIAAAVVATLAFWAYTRTLLPGVDLGDTGGLQAAAVYPETSARESYPLYFALAEPFVRVLSAANPARGLNLFSALAGALAVGLLAFVAARVTRSLPSGVAAGLFLTFSYTFWSQAVIAEVYTLHLALVALCLLALTTYQRRPTTARLALFFAVYAVSFGNHFWMILLLVPFALFLLLVHPRPGTLLRPRTIALALTIAAAGSLLYAGHFVAAWTDVDGSEGWSTRVANFWFDTSKADWRATMALGVDSSQTVDRLAMWWWDARQQVGLIGIGFAVIGAVRLFWISVPWGVLVASAYAASTLFALTYNVGDPHVFFLTGHLLTAFAAAAAVAPSAPAITWVRERVPARAARGEESVESGSSRTLRRKRTGFLVRLKADTTSRGFRHGQLAGGNGRLLSALAATPAVLAIVYGGWRGWDTWPAVDRQHDRRAEDLVARVAYGLRSPEALLVTELDWQVENALLYASRHDRRDLAWTRLADVLPHLPFLVGDNHAIGRDIVVTADAAPKIVAAYGSAMPLVEDEGLPVVSLYDQASRLPAGTPYALVVLTPVDRDRLEPGALDATLARLTGGRVSTGAADSYALWAGVVGDAPAFHHAAARPFRKAFTLLGDRFLVRMESWLPAETFRRGGFGRVLRGREPVLIVERGVSLVWFGRDASPATAYAAGLYAPARRFRIPAAAATLVTTTPRPQHSYATTSPAASPRGASATRAGTVNP